MAPARRYIVRQDDATTSVEALADGRYRVAGSNGLFAVARDADGEFTVTSGDQSWRVAVAGTPDAPWVGCAGAAARVEILPEGEAGSPRKREVQGALAAPMPGTVIDVAVRVGQQVRAGDVLVTLEAMKMELPVRSPRDGVVSAVRCSPGELVQPGPPLVEIA